MERKNMLTLGIVAVVIVIVLAGTYLYMRDDGGDHDGPRDLELGDTLYMANIDIVDGEETRYLSEMYAAATIDGNTCTLSTNPTSESTGWSPGMWKIPF